MSEAVGLPGELVTILFTDVEESSRMNAALGNTLYREKMRDPHFARLRSCIVAHHGHESGTPAGDSLMVVFEKAEEAIACAAAMQLSLSDPPLTCKDADDYAWRVAVRIGVHKAETEIFPAEDGTYGSSDVNFAARVMSLGEGEQIVVSDTAYGAAGNRQVYKWKEWRDRRIKSFDVPETVHELQWDGKERREPGSRWFPDWYKGERNRYISRPVLEKQILASFARVTVDNAPIRLVSLHGFGGLGKTRLAITCAVQTVGKFADGVCFVSLDNTHPSRDSVVEAISLALGRSGEEAQYQNLLAYLRDKEMLLVLDNYESVECEEVQRLLAELVVSASHLRVLVTGREAVKISDIEWVIPITGLTDAEAKELFTARARLKVRDWDAVSAEEQKALRSVLSLTECIPLAIEIVAAQIGNHELVEIAEALDDTPLPAMPDRHSLSDTNERHRSLTCCLDWSFQLLDSSAQSGFPRIGLFAGSFTAADVQGACSLPNAQNLLDRLNEAALVNRFAAEGRSRYTLRRPTRAYATDKLKALSEDEAIRRGFLTYYQHLLASNQELNNAAHRKLLDAEWTNIVAAIDIAEGLQEWDVVQSAIFDLLAFLQLRGMWGEWERLGVCALNATRVSKDRQNEGAALNNLGMVYDSQGRWEEAIRYYQDSLVIKREFQDRHGEGTTLMNLGIVYKSQGRWEEATRCYQDSLIIYREFQDHIGEGLTFNNLGVAYRHQGRWEEAI